MDKELIKKYFDDFCSKNHLDSFYYSYYFFINDILMNNSKQTNLFHDKDNDALLITYSFQNKFNSPFLPLVRREIDYEYMHLVNRFYNRLKTKIEKFVYVPHETLTVLSNGFKTIKMDVNYFYDTNEFLKLEGINFKPIRRYYNKFLKEHPTAIFEKLETKHIASTGNLLNDWVKNSRERMFRIFDTTANRNWLHNAHDTTFEQYNFVVTLDNEVIATVGYHRPYPDSNRVDLWIIKNQFWNHEGSTEYILVESFRKLNELGIFNVNYAGSLGIKGLNEFKKKMQPCRFTTEYSIVFK